MTKTQLKKRFDIALQALLQQGNIPTTFFSLPNLSKLATRKKKDHSPVTKLDQKIEKKVFSVLKKQFPQDGFLGEEFGEIASKNECRWIIDPIDGTESLTRGVRQFGTLLALEVKEKPIMGIAYLQGLEEIIFARQGEGAYWQKISTKGKRLAKPHRLKVTKTKKLKDAFLLFTSLQDFLKTDRLSPLCNIAKAVKNSRGWGDCLGHLLVATGRADIMIDPTLKIWDVAALKPILEEAGGKFSDVHGRDDILGASGISTNGFLHKQVIEMINAGHHVL